MTGAFPKRAGSAKNAFSGAERSITADMIDRLVSGTLRAVIMTAITLLAGGTLVCAHAGVLRICSGGAPAGVPLIGAAAALALAAALLIRYRNDLVDC